MNYFVEWWLKFLVNLILYFVNLLPSSRNLPTNLNSSEKRVLRVFFVQCLLFACFTLPTWDLLGFEKNIREGRLWRHETRNTITTSLSSDDRLELMLVVCFKGTLKNVWSWKKICKSTTGQRYIQGTILLFVALWHLCYSHSDFCDFTSRYLREMQ